MDAVTFEEATGELVLQLEMAMAKLAVAADSGIRTGELETACQKLSRKVKTAAESLTGLSLYKNVKGTEVYSWTITDNANFPDNLFIRYANLCKRCGKEQLEIRKESDIYFAKISGNLFVSIAELPEVELPEFKVKIEGNTLMAIRADLLAKLPEATRKLMSGNDNNENETEE